LKYFVYYSDDYYDDGGVGLEACETAKDAQHFIEQRISQDPTKRKIEYYIVIEGKERELITIESTIKVGIV